MQDYPDLQLPSGLDVIAGLLYVPLSMTGKDFIALLRKGQASDVNWAGRPPDTSGPTKSLEPRLSFKVTALIEIF
jgi:light-regulated signal transduction histidine kinase (bacteriophytochrome)